MAARLMAWAPKGAAFPAPRRLPRPYRCHPTSAAGCRTGGTDHPKHSRFSDRAKTTAACECYASRSRGRSRSGVGAAPQAVSRHWFTRAAKRLRHSQYSTRLQNCFCALLSLWRYCPQRCLIGSPGRLRRRRSCSPPKTSRRRESRAAAIASFTDRAARMNRDRIGSPSGPIPRAGRCRRVRGLFHAFQSRTEGDSLPQDCSAQSWRGGFLGW